VEEPYVFDREEFGLPGASYFEVLARSHGKEEGADGEPGEGFVLVGGGKLPHAFEDGARDGLLRSCSTVFRSVTAPLSR
jgi:hypothetical protein